LDIVAGPDGVDSFMKFGHLFADRSKGNGRDRRLNFPRREIAFSHFTQESEQFVFNFRYVIGKILQFLNAINR
jgi:hypothetical protein